MIKTEIKATLGWGDGDGIQQTVNVDIGTATKNQLRRMLGDKLKDLNKYIQQAVARRFWRIVATRMMEDIMEGQDAGESGASVSGGYWEPLSKKYMTAKGNKHIWVKLGKTAAWVNKIANQGVATSNWKRLTPPASISYVVHADAKRPLFGFADSDADKLAAIVREAIREAIDKHKRGRAMAVPIKPAGIVVKNTMSGTMKAKATRLVTSAKDAAKQRSQKKRSNIRATEKSLADREKFVKSYLRKNRKATLKQAVRKFYYERKKDKP